MTNNPINNLREIKDFITVKFGYIKYDPGVKLTEFTSITKKMMKNIGEGS